MVFPFFIRLSSELSRREQNFKLKGQNVSLAIQRAPSGIHMVYKSRAFKECKGNRSHMIECLSFSIGNVILR